MHIQLDDDPVFVARLTATFGFPTVAHILPSARQDQVRAHPEMLIGGELDQPASEDMRKVERRLYFRREDRRYQPVNPESGLFSKVSAWHTAIIVTKEAFICLQYHHRGTCSV